MISPWFYIAKLKKISEHSLLYTLFISSFTLYVFTYMRISPDCSFRNNWGLQKLRGVQIDSVASGLMQSFFYSHVSAVSWTPRRLHGSALSILYRRVWLRNVMSTADFLKNSPISAKPWWVYSDDINRAKISWVTILIHPTRKRVLKCNISIVLTP